MKALVLGLAMVFCVLPVIGCGGIPEDHRSDKLDQDADRAHRDLIDNRRLVLKFGLSPMRRNRRGEGTSVPAS